MTSEFIASEYALDTSELTTADLGEGLPPMPVEVVWLDSGLSIATGWQSRDNHIAHASLDRMKVRTVGLLMEINDEVVLVGLSHDPEHDTYFGAQAIARQNVISVRSLNFNNEPEESAQ